MGSASRARSLVIGANTYHRSSSSDCGLHRNSIWWQTMSRKC